MSESRQSNSGPLTRAICPACGGWVAVRRGGELREHPDHKHPMYNVPGAWRAGRVPVCAGSGMTRDERRAIR
jgi:hypothetical protein